MDGHGHGHGASLAATQRAFNAAASWIAQVCWDERSISNLTAHQRVYGETRLALALGAQRAVCAPMKAVEAVKSVRAKQRETCPRFGPRGSIRYDARTDRLMRLDRVCLNTVDGRVVCRLILGARQQERLVDPAWESGGADTVWRRGIYYRHIAHRREAPDKAASEGGVLGVDLGIVNLAPDSVGETFTGARIHIVCNRSPVRRQRLQQWGARTAKRRSRCLGRREARFQSTPHHGNSKQLVQKAVVSRKALAREDPSGLRERVTVRREHRYTRQSWAFFQLRQYIADTAAWTGVPV